jgi:ATP-dependent Clp protease ATP-binding subunit ClpC
VFERFTERARQVPVLARAEAQAFGHDFIGTEHLLLGLLREEEGLAARVLASFGVTVEDVRARVTEIVGSGEPGPLSGQMPFTPRAKKVLELSLREALATGNNYIGTEHILLGIVREAEGVAARILVDRGVDADSVRGAVGRQLSGEVGDRALAAAAWSGRMGYAPSGRRRFRHRSVWARLGAARDAALHEGRYDLARKLLELEIEERETGDDPGAEPAARA